MRNSGLSLLYVVLCGSFVTAADTDRGDKMLWAYFKSQTKEIADNSLAGITTKEQWEKQRPELRRQFLEMVGLWPLPARTDLKFTVTNKVETDKFTMETVHFQSAPGLYVTGNLYVPKNLKERAPAMLYVCGHGNFVKDKVSYGSKVPYQRHPTWFAENGYVCLILDTLQLGEIEGLHHGLYREKMWWWLSRGYTPAGIECWNAMRALDYLESRKDVDPKRMGVTGRSGGGATSWWLAAADERPQVIIPVAGIADLQAHLYDGSPGSLKGGAITGHCDCMYFVNTYRWDFSTVIALCAPRALLLGNSDADDIFPVPGYQRMATKVKKIYDLYGEGEKFQLLETKGPHKDTPELRQGAFLWCNRWLKEDKSPIKDPDNPGFEPKQLKVFDRLPDDEINTTIHESWIKPPVHRLPRSADVVKEWWPTKREEWLKELETKVFRGWPSKPPALKPTLAADVKHDGVRLRAYDFVSENEVELRLWLLTAEKVEKPKLVVLTSVDEAGWIDWTKELGPQFKDALQLKDAPEVDAKKFEQNKKALTFNQWAFATIAPRGIGPTRWGDKDASGRATDPHVRRRFALIGQTLDGQRVWDVRRGLAVLRGVSDLKEVPLWLQGTGDMAGVVLYASLFEPDVVRLDLWYPPASHRQGPTLLNVQRTLDMPQAMALAYPKAIRLYVNDEAEKEAWAWPMQLQESLGKNHLQIRKVGK